MSESDETATRLQTAVQSLVGTVDKQYINPIRKRSYLGSAACCDKFSSYQLQQCIQDAERPTQQATTIVDTSLKEFQERLQRCAFRCKDAAEESLPKTAKDAEIKKAQKRFEDCSLGCLREYEKKLPKLQKDIVDQLKQL